MARRILFAALILLAGLAAAAPMARADTEKRIALVIGNDAYATLGNLRNAGGDAAAMGEKLQGLGFETVSVRNADRAALLKALRGFRDKAAGAALALVYYAGHGIQAGGENYLLPIDIDVQDELDLPLAALPLANLVDQLHAAGAKRSLIILDACRDNPLVKRFADTAKGAGRDASAGRGLAVVGKTPTETVVWFSADAGQVAADGAGRHSPFAGALLAALDQPGLSTDDVFRAVARDLAKGGQAQTPRPYGQFLDAVYLNPATANAAAPPAAQPAPMATAPSVDREAMFWDSIKDSKNAADFKAYLKKYPKGDFADIARNRVEEFAPPPAPKQEVAAAAPPRTQDARKETAAITPPVEASATRDVALRNAQDAAAHNDFAQQLAWDRRAAALGSADAMYDIGAIYDSGLGVSEDFDEAVRWYRKAADLGNALAFMKVAWCYENGRGLPKDGAQALKWYLKAAQTGDVNAMNNAGRLYEDGIAGAKNHDEAMALWRRAASMGSGEAKRRLWAFGER